MKKEKPITGGFNNMRKTKRVQCCVKCEELEKRLAIIEEKISRLKGWSLYPSHGCAL